MSESFFFQLNSQSMLDLLESKLVPHPKGKAKTLTGPLRKGVGTDLSQPMSLPPSDKAVFSLQTKRNTVHLVLLVYKVRDFDANFNLIFVLYQVLQGDMDTFIKPYIKHSALSAKERKMAEEKAHEACHRYSERLSDFVPP